MWISQNIRYRPLFGEAFVRLGGKTFAPYGYISNAPSTARGVAVPCEGGDVTIGYEMGKSSLDEGEVEIRSLGGAYIRLNNDGTVEINGLTISSGGDIL